MIISFIIKLLNLFIFYFVIKITKDDATDNFGTLEEGGSGDEQKEEYEPQQTDIKADVQGSNTEGDLFEAIEEQVPPSVSSFGELVAIPRDSLKESPELVTIPGIAIKTAIKRKYGPRRKNTKVCKYIISSLPQH